MGFFLGRALFIFFTVNQRQQREEQDVQRSSFDRAVYRNDIRAKTLKENKEESLRRRTMRSGKHKTVFLVISRFGKDKKL